MYEHPETTVKERTWIGNPEDLAAMLEAVAAFIRTGEIAPSSVFDCVVSVSDESTSIRLYYL